MSISSFAFQLQWNPALRTPALYGQFRLSRQKAHIFSLKLTRFIRTPVNTDNGHFSVSRVTNSHILSTPQLRTLVICTWYFYTKTSTPIDCLSTYFYRSLVRKTVCFGLYIDKTCVPDVFSESPLNTDSTMACPLGVLINRVPLYLSMSLVFLHFTFEMSPSANSLSTLLLVVCVFF